MAAIMTPGTGLQPPRIVAIFSAASVRTFPQSIRWGRAKQGKVTGSVPIGDLWRRQGVEISLEIENQQYDFGLADLRFVDRVDFHLSLRESPGSLGFVIEMTLARSDGLIAPRIKPSGSTQIEPRRTHYVDLGAKGPVKLTFDGRDLKADTIRKAKRPSAISEAFQALIRGFRK